MSQYLLFNAEVTKKVEALFEYTSTYLSGSKKGSYNTTSMLIIQYPEKPE